MAEETVQDRNKRMGWGCKCHGTTFCPDFKFAGYENDVPVFGPKTRNAAPASPVRHNAACIEPTGGSETQA